jgi:hypothetical protein
VGSRNGCALGRDIRGRTCGCGRFSGRYGVSCQLRPVCRDRPEPKADYKQNSMPKRSVRTEDFHEDLPARRAARVETGDVALFCPVLPFQLRNAHPIAARCTSGRAVPGRLRNLARQMLDSGQAVNCRALCRSAAEFGPAIRCLPRVLPGFPYLPPQIPLAPLNRNAYKAAAFGYSCQPSVVWAGSNPKTGNYRYDPLHVARHKEKEHAVMEMSGSAFSLQRLP